MRPVFCLAKFHDGTLKKITLFTELSFTTIGRSRIFDLTPSIHAGTAPRLPIYSLDESVPRQ